MANAEKVAAFLASQPKVQWVRYPGLAEHPQHGVAQRQFGGLGFGGMFTFGLADQDACFRLIKGLKLVYHLANIGDCKSLIIHPFSSQYLSFAPEIKKSLSITPDLVRLSVGIEAAEDIIDDLAQALENV